MSLPCAHPAAAPGALGVGLALAAPADAAGVAGLLGWAGWADARGLHSLWLPEAHFRPGATPAPLVLLGALAARTQRIGLGTSSLLIPLHDPLRTAAAVATLDQLSGGRVLLGLGRGFDPALFRTLGLDPRAKRDRFDAALDTILAAWRDAHPRAGVRTRQRPHPPLFVAAFGRKGLRQAARRGLPYLASPLETLGTLAENQAFHRRELPHGVDPDALGVPVMRTVHVAGDAAEAQRVLDALEAEARRMLRRLGPTLARAASGSLAERVLVGDADAVAANLARYRARLGMDLLIVRPAPGVPPPAQRASLLRLLEEVLPGLP